MLGVLVPSFCIDTYFPAVMWKNNGEMIEFRMVVTKQTSSTLSPSFIPFAITACAIDPVARGTWMALAFGGSNTPNPNEPMVFFFVSAFRSFSPHI